MSKGDDKIKFQGRVITAAGKGRFVVETTEGHTVKCVLSGKMRTRNIKVIEGDKVDVEVSIYDVNTGIIVYRTK